jgi:hypothetical protein
MIDVNAGDVAFLVQVDHHAGGDLTTLNARTFAECGTDGSSPSSRQRKGDRFHADPGDSGLRPMTAGPAHAELRRVSVRFD